MQVFLSQLLTRARQQHYAVGAFNIYNLEGALAVIGAAEELKSPVMLQILPSALAIGGSPLIALSRAAADAAKIPVAVHLDHCSEQKDIFTALDAGVGSTMADGSALSFEENIRFTIKDSGFGQEIFSRCGGGTGVFDRNRGRPCNGR